MDMKMTEALTMGEYLEAVATQGLDAFESLVAQGYHPKVVMAKAEKASKRQYTDYGVSPKFSWITQRGWEYLEGEGISVRPTHFAAAGRFRRSWDSPVGGS